MVAYKTDPLGLNDTVNASASAASTNPNAAGHRNKRSFRHLANKLSVKKNRKAAAAAAAASSGVATTCNTAVASSSIKSTPSPVVVVEPTAQEDSKPAAALLTKHESDHNPIAAERMEDQKDATLLDPTNGSGDQRRVSKVIQKITSCLPKPGDVTANEKVLIVTFLTFFVFTIAQFVLAFAANSLSLLGDTAAQIVDCVDYCINFYAERRKHSFDQRYQDPSSPDELTPERALQLRERAKRKAVLFWEVVPPMISVTCLVGVTMYVLEDSIRTLIGDFTTTPKSQQGNVNLTLVLTLQLINLVVDVTDVTCFAKIHHLRGFETMHQPLAIKTDGENIVPEEHDGDIALSNVQQQHADMEVGCGGSLLKEEVQSIIEEPSSHAGAVDEAKDEDDVAPNANVDHETKGTSTVETVNASHPVVCHDDHVDKANLNMCSAYTHVLADSMRTVSILGAVILSLLISSITAEVADSAAAVAVSFIILVALLPLIRGLVFASLELRQIKAEEQAEVISNMSG